MDDQLQSLRLRLEQQKIAQELARKRWLMEASIQQQLESGLREQQERRDYELASRSTQYGNKEQHEAAINGSSSQPGSFSGKHDLSKWKFPELRDTINTSCDLELLEACRAEFHRRLVAYHAWRCKNKKKTAIEPQTRTSAPAPPMTSAGGAQAPLHSSISTCERYFRLPFMRPTGPNYERLLPQYDQNRGFWFAHFIGEWIVRQMELHPAKPPVLLEAGKDDLSMCELTLEESGLTRKKGAEISAEDFEREWRRHGGKPYEYHYILCTQLALVKTSVAIYDIANLRTIVRS